MLIKDGTFVISNTKKLIQFAEIGCFTIETENFLSIIFQSDFN